MIVPRAWSAVALHTRALGSSARYVRLRMSSTLITRHALHALLELAQMSTRQTASTVWTVGIQRSEYVWSALFQMSSLLTELAVWRLHCVQRARNAQTQPGATIRMIVQPARLALLAHLAVCVKLAVRLAKWQTRHRRFVRHVSQAALLLQTARCANSVTARPTRALVLTVSAATLRMSSMLTAPHALLALLALDPTAIEQNV